MLSNYVGLLGFLETPTTTAPLIIEAYGGAEFVVAIEIPVCSLSKTVTF